jgi:RNA recognition motif-containing protein
MELHKKKSERQKWNDGAAVVGEQSASDEEDVDGVEPASAKQSDDQRARSNKEDDDDMAFIKSKKVAKLSDEEEEADDIEDEDMEEAEEASSSDKKHYKYGVLPTVKVRGLPLKCKKGKVKHFFAPLKPFHVRMAKGVKGIAYVVFKKPEDIPKALTKHRSFLGSYT